MGGDPRTLAILKRSERIHEGSIPALAPLLSDELATAREPLAVPQITRLVIDNDEAVSLAALEALGATADLDVLKVLVREVLTPRSPTRGAAAVAALRGDPTLRYRTPSRGGWEAG